MPPEYAKGGPRSGEPAGHALGRSRGGLSAKVHLAADGGACPFAFTVTVGQAGDASAFESVMSRIRVPCGGPGRPRTRPFAVLADRAYSVPCHPRPPAAPGNSSGHPAAVRPGRPLPAAGPPRRLPARLRPRGIQAAEHRRVVHQPAKTVARPGRTNRQTRYRLPGRTPPRRHHHLDPTLTKETEPSRSTNSSWYRAPAPGARPRAPPRTRSRRPSAAAAHGEANSSTSAASCTVGIPVNNGCAQTARSTMPFTYHESMPTRYHAPTR
ncbi:hypothetical protein K376_00248 [Streptomyces sp. PsTaAH-130]|nr:hypothetical protein K376_00248 [Streptomyces sp. PsTaAH-130]